MNIKSFNKTVSFIVAMFLALVLLVSGTATFTLAEDEVPTEDETVLTEEVSTDTETDQAEETLAEDEIAVEDETTLTEETVSVEDEIVSEEAEVAEEPLYGAPASEFSQDNDSGEMRLLSSELSINTISTSNMSDCEAFVKTALANEGVYAWDLDVVEGWCADFVYSCAMAAGIGRDVIPYTGWPAGMYYTLLGDLGGKEVSSPKAGDLVFYFRGDDCYHVGIVINSNQAINGNWGNSSDFDSYVAVAPIAYYDYMEQGTDYRFIRPAFADGSGGKVADIAAQNTPYDSGGYYSDSNYYYDEFAIFDSVYLPDSPASDGTWYIRYKSSNNIAYGVTTVICNSYGWWYVEDGKVDFSYNGFAENPFGFWYIRNGKVIFDYYGVAPGTYGWWRVEGGKVIFDYTGLAPNEYGWWYLEDGLVDFTYQSLVPNEYGWWFVKDGKVRFDWWGVEYNPYGWWRIENGKVNFDFNGLAPNEYGWWYLEGGKVDFSYHGLVEYGGDFWYVDGGNLKFDYYGLAQGTYGWWVVEGGRVNFDYTGWYTYKGNTYTIVEGKVQQSVVYDD